MSSDNTRDSLRVFEKSAKRSKAVGLKVYGTYVVWGIERNALASFELTSSAMHPRLLIIGAVCAEKLNPWIPYHALAMFFQPT